MKCQKWNTFLDFSLWSCMWTISFPPLSPPCVSLRHCLTKILQQSLHCQCCCSGLIGSQPRVWCHYPSEDFNLGALDAYWEDLWTLWSDVQTHLHNKIFIWLLNESMTQRQSTKQFSNKSTVGRLHKACSLHRVDPKLMAITLLLHLLKCQIWHKKFTNFLFL